MASIKIEDALKKFDTQYYKSNVKKENIDAVLHNTKFYLSEIEKAINKNQPEEHLKNLTNEYLKKSFLNTDEYTINVDKRIDSAVYKNDELLLLIETKKVSNRNEMVDADNINKKAFHELILYYLNATRVFNGKKMQRNLNVSVRRVLITNALTWVIVDAKDIEDLVTGYIEKHYYEYINKILPITKNEQFYKDIENYLDKIDINNRIKFVYFNIKDYCNNEKIELLYKILKNSYLLKEGIFNEKTIHVLNDKFYQELLYILGLKETADKKGNNHKIEIDLNVTNSISYQIFNKLINNKGMKEDDAKEITLELVIVWMNRLLFIKLFEGQLIAINGDEEKYHILDNNKISSFDDLQYLFFDVLGKEDRDNFDEKFKNIPYLNSALFERYDIEQKYYNIDILKNERIAVKKRGMLDKKEESLLTYIIEFLNSYNFGSELDKYNKVVNKKDIIDASVLGLIFEKLNGYKEGSFYTPSNVTEYMAKISVESCVLDKINKKYKWSCSNLYDVKIKMTKTLSEAIEINEIINSIKVCDIAVGSGHFLVSVLNRIIYIKKYLNVLFKYGKNELLTEYDIDIDDDTLRIIDGQGNRFKYNKMNALSQSIQQTLFNEKKNIIENSIYGVDINTKAIAICQLRLWIELLKNAYYENEKMKTLPNIDINLKSGNSLVNRIKYSVNDTAKLTDIKYKKIKEDVKVYKELVKQYINSSNKSVKKQIEEKIKEIKNEILKREVISEYKIMTANNVAEIFNEKEDNDLYRNTFEWAIEFPKLLDENGKFIGFDCIIGNPPYSTLNKKQNQKIGIEISNSILDYYKKNPLYSNALGGVLNIYRLFMCRTIDLLNEGGYNCLIVPMSFLCDEGTKDLRFYYCNQTELKRIDIFPEKDNVNKRIFKEAKVSVCIVLNKKTVTNKVIPLRVFLDNEINDNKDYINIGLDELWGINKDLKLPLLKNDIEYELYKKISDNKKLKEYSKCYVGEIDLTNCNKFITNDINDDIMLRGAQVQKFRITNDISQGEIMYLKGDNYRESIKNNNKKLEHYRRRRIVMQAITGVNEKNRLVMTMCPPNYYLANSVNYLVPNMDNNKDYYLLGLLNSELLNWYFKKISTNNNVNGVDVDAIPIKEGTNEQIRSIISIVKDLLNKFDENKVKEMNSIIYDIYAVNDDEKMIICE